MVWGNCKYLSIFKSFSFPGVRDQHYLRYGQFWLVPATYRFSHSKRSWSLGSSESIPVCLVPLQSFPPQSPQGPFWSILVGSIVDSCWPRIVLVSFPLVPFGSVRFRFVSTRSGQFWLAPALSSSNFFWPLKKYGIYIALISWSSKRFATLCGGLCQTAYLGANCSHAVHSLIWENSRIHRCPQNSIRFKPSHRGLRPLLFSKSVWVL